MTFCLVSVTGLRPSPLSGWCVNPLGTLVPTVLDIWGSREEKEDGKTENAGVKENRFDGGALVC